MPKRGSTGDRAQRLCGWGAQAATEIRDRRAAVGGGALVPVPVTTLQAPLSVLRPPGHKGHRAGASGPRLERPRIKSAVAVAAGGGVISGEHPPVLVSWLHATLALERTSSVCHLNQY